MIITINGTDYEVNSQRDIDALYERFNFTTSHNLTLTERFTSLNILMPSRFPSLKEFASRWCSNV